MKKEFDKYPAYYNPDDKMSAPLSCFLRRRRCIAVRRSLSSLLQNFAALPSGKAVTLELLRGNFLRINSRRHEAICKLFGACSGHGKSLPSTTRALFLAFFRYIWHSRLEKSWYVSNDLGGDIAFNQAESDIVDQSKVDYAFEYYRPPAPGFRTSAVVISQ